MVKVLTKKSDLKKGNIIFFLEKVSDISTLDFLKLDKSVSVKLKELVLKKESFKKEFFVGNSKVDSLFVVHFGKNDKSSVEEFLGKNFKSLPCEFTVVSNSGKEDINLLNASTLSRYKFQKYKSEKKEDKISFLVDSKSEKELKTRLKTIKNIYLSRDLGETPAEDLTPKIYADLVKSTKFKNIKVKVLNSKDIQKKGLNLLYAVGRGSPNKPRMVILEKIIDKKLPTYAFIGKGITFDTGGLDVKPDPHMNEMRGDMGGSSVVFATMKELDDKKLKYNLVACMPLAENSVSGDSYRPSDIFTSYSGKTVEIDNTDAEGRLVLADAISYISKNYKTKKIISIATLTGAAMYALGFRYCPIMGTDKKLIEKIVKNSETDYEKYVQIPFDNYFVEKTKGNYADVSNLNRQTYAGTTMGAAFLYNFLMNSEDYTHIDIAGTYINSYEQYGFANKGMTGFGVHSLSKIFQEL